MYRFDALWLLQCIFSKDLNPPMCWKSIKKAHICVVVVVVWLWAQGCKEVSSTAVHPWMEQAEPQRPRYRVWQPVRPQPRPAPSVMLLRSPPIQRAAPQQRSLSKLWMEVTWWQSRIFLEACPVCRKEMRFRPLLRTLLTRHIYPVRIMLSLRPWSPLSPLRAACPPWRWWGHLCKPPRFPLRAQSSPLQQWPVSPALKVQVLWSTLSSHPKPSFRPRRRYPRYQLCPREQPYLP